MKRLCRNVLLNMAVALCLIGSGCGTGNNVRVTGQLVKDGKPYTAKLEGSEPETFAVDFATTVDNAKFLFPATINADGKFRVDGPEGSGIPKGQYRITVLHSGFMGAGGDRLQARFAGDKTPLTVDVTENTSLTIDLGAGTATKSN